MPEYRKIIFKKGDLLPYVGLRSFERRNIDSLKDPHNKDNWKYRCLEGYTAAWIVGLAVAVLLSIPYAT